MEYVRLQALKKICELIETDTGMKAYRGRQVVGSDIKMPFINISETIRSGDSKTASNRTVRKDRADFLLSGYIDNTDFENPIDVLYDLIAKVEKCFAKIVGIHARSGNPIAKEWYNLDGLVTDFVYEAPVAHNPPDEVQSKSYFYFYFSFVQAYSAEDPYTILDRNTTL